MLELLGGAPPAVMIWMLTAPGAWPSPYSAAVRTSRYLYFLASFSLRAQCCCYISFIYYLFIIFIIFWLIRRKQIHRKLNSRKNRNKLIFPLLLNRIAPGGQKSCCLRCGHLACGSHRPRWMPTPP